MLHAITVIDHTGAERRARGIDDTDVQGQDKGSRLLLISAPHHVSASDSSVLIDHTHKIYEPLRLSSCDPNRRNVRDV